MNPCVKVRMSENIQPHEIQPLELTVLSKLNIRGQFSVIVNPCVTTPDTSLVTDYMQTNVQITMVRTVV